MHTRFEISEELAVEVGALIQLDIDATRALEQAIRGIEPEHPGLKRQLGIFRAEHERHVLELAALLSVRGHQPPPFRRDLRGVIVEGLTAARAAFGTLPALKAVRQMELRTNRRYEEGRRILDGLPPQMQLLIRRSHEDERRHLAFVEQALAAIESAGAANV